MYLFIYNDLNGMFWLEKKSSFGLVDLDSRVSD